MLSDSYAQEVFLGYLCCWETAGSPLAPQKARDSDSKLNGTESFAVILLLFMKIASILHAREPGVLL